MTLAFITFMAGTAPAETYVEGYIGNNFTVGSPNSLEINVNPAYRGPIKASPEYPRTVSSALMGGAKLGTWFSNQGFPKIDYPEWMKYLGVYLDFSFHGMDLWRNMGTRRMNIVPSNYPYFTQYKFLGTGNIATIGFMFACRYGFLPTEKVPFGKLQPYVAVGPALMITSFSPTYMQQPNNNYELFPIEDFPREFSASSKTVVNLGLEAELGLRYYFTRKDGPKGRAISLETAVKYRYVRPSLSYSLSAEGFTHQLRYAPQFHLFSIYSGLAYHF